MDSLRPWLWASLCLSIGIGCGDDAAADGGGDAGAAGADAGTDAETRPAYDPELVDLGPPPACGADVVRLHDGASLRVFTVAPRIDFEALASQAAYREGMHRLVHTKVAGCLATDRPNLVVFPEDTGLAATFIGSRGARARTNASAPLAYLDLQGQYAAQLEYYQERFDRRNVSPGLGVLLSTTDTVWRAVHDTFSRLAATYGVYLSVSYWGADIEEVTDPEVVAALADPDYAPPPGVFVARTLEVRNNQLLFGPDGALIAVVPKVHLVPTETFLDMKAGSLQGMAPMQLPFGRVGVVCSRDSWMPDVMMRLDDLGTEITLQTEAFDGGWTMLDHPESVPGEWNPDVLMESCHFHVQRYGAVRFCLTPMLTGNYFDLVFDGQSHVVHDARSDDTPLGFVGNAPEAGFLAVGDWVVPDPGVADPSLSRDRRRSMLRDVGRALSPGSGDPRENSYRETVMAVDVDPARTDAYRSEQPSAATIPGEPPRVGVLLAFGEPPRRSIQLRWGAPVVGGSTIVAAGGEVDRFRPSLLVLDGRLIALWHERSDDGERLMFADAASVDGAFGTPRELVGPGTGLPGGVWPMAARATTDGVRVAVSFSAVSATGARAMVIVSPAGDAPAGAPVEIEARPGGLDDDSAYQWAPVPAITADGAVVVGWIDRRAQDWVLLVAASRDGGRSFGVPVRLSDVPPDAERIEQDLSLVPGERGEVFAVWSNLQSRRPDRDLSAARIVVDAVGDVTIDRDAALAALGPAGQEQDNQMMPALARDGTALEAVWADDAGGPVRLRGRRFEAGAWGAEHEIDIPPLSAPDAEAHLVEPSLVVAGGTVYAVAVAVEPDGRHHLVVAEPLP